MGLQDKIQIKSNDYMILPMIVGYKPCSFLHELVAVLESLYFLCLDPAVLRQDYNESAHAGSLKLLPTTFTEPINRAPSRLAGLRGSQISCSSPGVHRSPPSRPIRATAGG